MPAIIASETSSANCLITMFLPDAAQVEAAFRAEESSNDGISIVIKVAAKRTPKVGHFRPYSDSPLLGTRLDPSAGETLG